MIKEFSKEILDSFGVEYDDEDKKWFDIYNEFHNRLEITIVSFVSFFIA